MGTLTSSVKKLAKQKQEISKIRRLTEKQFKKAKLTSRKYSSTLTSLEKRVNSSRTQIEDFSQTLNQKIAQLESVQRLKKSAQERLDFETQNKEQLEKEIRENIGEISIKRDPRITKYDDTYSLTPYATYMLTAISMPDGGHVFSRYDDCFGTWNDGECLFERRLLLD